MTDLPAALHGFLDTAHHGALIGASVASAVLIAAGLWIMVRRAYFGLKAHDLAVLDRRSPSHWRGH